MVCGKPPEPSRPRALAPRPPWWLRSEAARRSPPAWKCTKRTLPAGTFSTAPRNQLGVGGRRQTFTSGQHSFSESFSCCFLFLLLFLFLLPLSSFYIYIASSFSISAPPRPPSPPLVHLDHILCAFFLFLFSLIIIDIVVIRSLGHTHTIIGGNICVSFAQDMLLSTRERPSQTHFGKISLSKERWITH